MYLISSVLYMYSIDGQAHFFVSSKIHMYTYYLTTAIWALWIRNQVCHNIILKVSFYYGIIHSLETKSHSFLLTWQKTRQISGWKIRHFIKLSDTRLKLSESLSGSIAKVSVERCDIDCYVAHKVWTNHLIDMESSYVVVKDFLCIFLKIVKIFLVLFFKPSINFYSEVSRSAESYWYMSNWNFLSNSSKTRQFST